MTGTVETLESTKMYKSPFPTQGDGIGLTKPAPVQRGQAIDISCTLDPDGCFRAIDRNNYDVDCDHTGFFTKSPTGYGRTPLDAIVDLLDETDERAGK